MKRKASVRSLLNWLGMRPRDGVAVEEGEELAEGVKERPVWEQTDALVGVDGALGGAAAAAPATAAAAAAAAAEEMERGGAAQAQEGELLIRQTLLREGLVELNGGAVDLKHKWSHEQREGCTTTTTTSSSCSQLLRPPFLSPSKMCEMSKKKLSFWEEAVNRGLTVLSSGHLEELFVCFFLFDEWQLAASLESVAKIWALTSSFSFASS